MIITPLPLDAVKNMFYELNLAQAVDLLSFAVKLWVFLIAFVDLLDLRDSVF